MRGEFILTRQDMINYLIRWHFPDFEAAQRSVRAANNKNLPTQSWENEIIKNAEIYAQTLNSLAPTDLLKIFDVELENNNKRDEAEYFFNKDSSSVDFNIFFQHDRWTIDECTALTLRKNPRIVNSESINIGTYVNSAFFSKYFEVHEIIKRAVEGAILEASYYDELDIPLIEKHSFINWAQSRLIDFPIELVDLATEKENSHASEAMIKTIENKNEIIKKLEYDIINLTSELEICRKKLAELPQTGKDSRVDPRIVTSLRLMLSAMAEKKYRFVADSKTNPTAALIKTDMHLLGVNMDEETILNQIRKSYELFQEKKRK
jgi:hypothetical protein